MQPTNTPKTVYRFGDGVYINLTNHCPNLCAFCIKTKWKMDFHGNNLNLSGNEPSGGEVVFTGTPREMLEHGETITAKYLRK